MAGVCDMVEAERNSEETQTTMGIENRGFASLSAKARREMARKGGKAAHAAGTAHQWTSEEARKAGHKGGIATRTKIQQLTSPPAKQTESVTTTS